MAAPRRRKLEDERVFGRDTAALRRRLVLYRHQIAELLVRDGVRHVLRAGDENKKRTPVLDIVPELLDDVFRKHVFADVAHYDDVELAPVVVLYRPSAGLGLPERTRCTRIFEKLRLDAVD